MRNIFSTQPATDEDDHMNNESIEVNPDAILPLHAQDALRLYGDGTNSHSNQFLPGNSSLHRSSSSASFSSVPGGAVGQYSSGTDSSRDIGPAEAPAMMVQNGGQHTDRMAIPLGAGDVMFQAHPTPLPLPDYRNYNHNSSNNRNNNSYINVSVEHMNSNSNYSYKTENDYSYDASYEYSMEKDPADGPNNELSQHSLPTPAGANADLQATAGEPVALETASVSNTADQAVFGDQHMSTKKGSSDNNRRLLCIGSTICLLLAIAVVAVAVVLGTKDDGGSGLDTNEAVFDPDDPNEFAPTPVPMEDDEIFGFPEPEEPDEPLDLTDYCPLNLELDGVVLSDFQQDIILYGTVDQTSPLGISNNPNATAEIHELPSCQVNSVYGRGLWYTVRGPGAVVRATTCQTLSMAMDPANPNPSEAPLDTQLTVFESQTEKCTDGLSCVVANDNGPCGYQSAVSWYAEQGRLYYIYVSGAPTSVIASRPNSDLFQVQSEEETVPYPTGSFALKLSLAPVGTCEAAIDFSEAESTPLSTFMMDIDQQTRMPYTSSLVKGELLGTVNGDMDPCEPDVFLGRGGEVWYRITGGDTGGWMHASTCEGEINEFSTRLALYQGSCQELECSVGRASDNAPSVDRDCGIGNSLNWWAEPGVDYYIMVFKTNFLPGVKFGLTVKELDPPSNDNCTGAIQLTPNGEVNFGSTLRATYVSDQLAPTCSALDGSDVTHSHPGVWYQVVGTGARLTASLCNEMTQFDTKISVFTGSCGSLQCVSANNQWCGYQSSVDWESTPGTTYYILVHGATGGTSSSLGDFGLAVFEFLPSSNDLCPDAILLEPGAVERGSTSIASADENFESCNHVVAKSKNQAPGVWYKIVGTNSGMRASTCGSETTFDTRISIYKGESCDELQCIVSDDNGCGFQSSAYWYASEGETYYILVTGNLFINFGDFVLRTEEYRTNTINDFCYNAIPASTTSVNIGSTKNATFDGVKTCVVDQTAPGIWYKVTGTGMGMVASTCHSVTDFDTRISVFRGSNCEELECVAGNDDIQEVLEECGSSSSSKASWLSQIGQEYRILVHGWGALTGTFGLEIEEVVPKVANDFCITSIDMQVSLAQSTSVTEPQHTYGTNVDATVDNVPICGDVEVNGHGIWYRSVGTGNRIQASTCNQAVPDMDSNSFVPSTLSPGVVTDFDTQISVFRGGCRSLECVGANNDRCGVQSSVNFLVNQGEVFYVLVHGSAEGRGSFGLVLEEIFPQVGNDFCDTATSITVPPGGTTTEFVGSTEDALYDNVEECVVPNTSPGVWYTLVGTGLTITATTCGSMTNFDTRISVFTGSCAALECVTGNDDTSQEEISCGLQSTASWLSVEGQTYYVRVHGWGSMVGTFQLTISEATGSRQIGTAEGDASEVSNQVLPATENLANEPAKPPPSDTDFLGLP